MRDNLKDIEYFEKYINGQEKTIDFFVDNTKGKELPPEGLRTFNLTINLKRRNILIAKYSVGKAADDILSDYMNSIDWFIKTYNSTSFYVQLVWMLSIGILFEIEENTFSKLTKMVANDNPNDYLIDFLINSRDKSWEIKNKTFKFDKPYGYLKAVIEETDKIETLKKLTEYLNKVWYKGHSSAGWHNSHNSKHDTYAGYWSFESGAIAKILGLDDSSLKDQQYYPYDMVHFKD